MVFLALRHPRPEDEHRVKFEASRKGFNYNDICCTKNDFLVRDLEEWGWNVDHASVQVGKGRRAFETASACLRRWGHFNLGWTAVDPGSTGTRKGDLVAVTSRTLFLWTCNPLRVVYSDVKNPPLLRLPWQPPPQRSFEFAHGCLQGHMLKGEEAFRVLMKPDGTVWYDITTFSKPLHPLAIGFYPLTRFFQKKFISDSARAVVAAVAEAS